MKNHLTKIFLAAALTFTIGVPPSLAQGTQTASTATTSTKSKHSKKATNSSATSAAAASTSTAPAANTTKASSRTPISNASDADIAAAKASGKVWVNTETGVYHKSGRYYGKTKQGKFMTEADAQKAGYHEAKTGAAASKKKSS